ncbi:hypothetical protein WJX73_001249 [Symbiochloris irregularis]|uniref:Uncharacterized protein n=1 Tax=Symbiochloris irregularis TaxID=706552 RepID=A0AAW1NP99_9CHLO
MSWTPVACQSLSGTNTPGDASCYGALQPGEPLLLGDKAALGDLYNAASTPKQHWNRTKHHHNKENDAANASDSMPWARQHQWAAAKKTEARQPLQDVTHLFTPPTHLLHSAFSYTPDYTPLGLGPPVASSSAHTLRHMR